MLEVQRLAAQVVAAVLAGRSLNDALEQAQASESLMPSDRAALQALSYGTLRHLGYLRFALSRLAPRQPKQPAIAALLWVALHQLEHTGAAQYAVVDSAVENAGSLGRREMKPFTNAVLRTYLRKREAVLSAAHGDPVACFSYPIWWIERVRREFPERADDILQAGNLHPPMTLRVNRRRVGADRYLALLVEAGLQARRVGPCAITLAQPMPVARVPGFSEGLVSVQDLGAQLAAPMLELSAGQRVLDACSAPGGKTAHILECADVELLALDSDPIRLARVAANLSRLGLSATVKPADAGEISAWWDGRPFDRVLLDAPCSASGVVRRHPDIKWLRRETDIAGFARQQRRLLDALWKVLVPGGKLLYVTCSIFREENQDQIDAFLARHDDARHIAGAPGLLLPDEEHDGFYHALLEKI
ncbi:MAG: 16S rRNA (cytosine(967)-C(5))-methyltransferase RsmB [Burkholderiales bacterium]